MRIGRAHALNIGSFPAPFAEREPSEWVRIWDSVRFLHKYVGSSARCTLVSY